MKNGCNFYQDCLDCPQYYKNKCHYEKSTSFISGEIRLYFSEIIYRIQLSWKARHWLGHKEYMNVLMDENKRGN